jgi:hypothetical protein
LKTLPERGFVLDGELAAKSTFRTAPEIARNSLILHSLLKKPRFLTMIEKPLKKVRHAWNQA